MTQGVEVVLALGVLSRVDNSTLCEQDEPVEKGNDVASRLVNSEDDGSIVLSGEGDERLNDVERVESIET